MLTQTLIHKASKFAESVGREVRQAVRLILQANGGWGRQVEEALRRRLTDGPRASGVRTLVIDTDASGMQGYAPGEAYALTRVPIRKILTRMMRDVNAYPQFRALFGSYLNKLWQAIGSIDDIYLGAMMTRVLGMAALRFHLERHPELLDVLQRAARQLNRFSTDGGHCSGNGRGSYDPAGHDDEAPTTTCQVQSNPGGNGSGIRQAVADLLKHLLDQLGICQRMVSITALPSVFGNLSLLDEARLRAHAYADLLERLVRYQRPLTPWDAGLAGQVERDGPVYELAYFLEGVNMRGKVYDSAQAVAAVAAEFIRMTLLGGALADRFTAATQNLFRHLQPPYVGASFGVFVYEIPIEKIIQQFGFWLSRLGIRQLLRACSQADLEQLAARQVQVFMTQSGIQDRSQWFRATPQGEKIKPNVQPFRGKPRQELPSIRENYELKNFPAWQRAIVSLADARYEDLAAWLDDQVLNLINSFGLRQARQVLDRPDGVCFGQALDKLTQGLQRQLERQHQQLAALQQEEARRRSSPIWRRATLAPRDRYCSAWQAELDLKLSIIQLPGYLRVFTRLQERVKFHVKEIDGCISELEELDDRLAAREQVFSHERQSTPEIIQCALCPDEERQIFEQHTPSVLGLFLNGLRFVRRGEELTLLYSTDRPEGAGQRRLLLSEAGIRRHLEYACGLWEFLRQELSVEALLQQRGESPLQLVEKWFRYAAPLINLDELDQEKPLIHLMMMGSQHGADAFWKGTLKPHLTIESTGNPFQIECVYAVFGLNPLALAQAEAMRASYEQMRAAGEPLHVYPEAELAGDGQEPVSKTGKKKNRRKPHGAK